MADYDLMTRFLIACKDSKIHYLPETIVAMRSGGISSNLNFRSFYNRNLEDYAVIKKNRIGGLLTLLKKKTRKLNQVNLNRN